MIPFPKTVLTAATAALIAGGTVYYSQTIAPPPANTLHIERVNANCATQVTLASGYLTNYGGTNFAFSIPAEGVSNAFAQVHVINGPAVLISWIAQAGVSYILQFSTDLAHWFDIPWVFVGSGGVMSWLDDGSSVQKFFRLRIL